MTGSGGSRIAEAVFWLSAGLIGATYVGVPLVVLARGVLRRRPIAAGSIRPSVSVVIAARNEAANIGARLTNLLDGESPAGGLEIVVASEIGRAHV